MRKVFVVIVTYNGEKWIDKVLSAMNGSTYTVQTIVIDNGSKDQTVAIIKEKYQNVILMQPIANLGFGRANNLGIKYALENGADYVFLLNQDAWFAPDAMQALVNAAEKYPEYGILSPVHLNGAGDALDLGFSKYVAPRSCPDFYSDLYVGKLKDVYTCTFVNAAAWLVTRKCLEDVGGFNPFFFMYSEDNDFVQRLHAYKFKLGIVPKAIGHHDRETRKDMPKKLKIERNFRTFSAMQLFDISVPFSKAYLRFLKGSFVSFITLGFGNCISPFMELNKSLGRIKEIRKFLEKRGGFNWNFK